MTSKLDISFWNSPSLYSSSLLRNKWILLGAQAPFLNWNKRTILNKLCRMNLLPSFKSMAGGVNMEWLLFSRGKLKVVCSAAAEHCLNFSHQHRTVYFSNIYLHHFSSKMSLKVKFHQRKHFFFPWNSLLRDRQEMMSHTHQVRIAIRKTKLTLYTAACR